MYKKGDKVKIISDSIDSIEFNGKICIVVDTFDSGLIDDKTGNYKEQLLTLKVKDSDRISFCLYDYEVKLVK